MRFSLRIRYTEPRSLVELVSTAEAVGLHGVWISEPWGFDAGSVLGWCAANTRRLMLGTHVASVFARSPAATAGMAASLWSLSRGRFRLGLGTSGPAVVEGWHGAQYARPLARTRDTIEVIRQVLSGSPVDFSGSTLSVPRAGSEFTPMRFAQREEHAQVPIYLGALGPRNQRLTAEVADGWTPTPYSPDHADVFADPLLSTLRANGRRIVIAPVAPIAIGTDRNRTIDLERGWSALYLGAMGEYYARAAQRMGFGEMVDSVRRHWCDGDRSAAKRALDTDYLDAIGLFGTPRRIAEQLRRYEAAGVDEVVLELRKKDLADQVADLKALGREVIS
jgi:F420-dependent oxidoreductase-like protein